MGSPKLYNALVLVVAIWPLVSCSEKLQSTEVETLLKIREILNFPGALSNWTVKTDFCNTELTSSVTVACYGGSVSQLHIIGNRGAQQLLPHNISVEALVTTLSKLSSLKVLSLVSLGLGGELPTQIAQLSSLEILNMSLNSFSGPISRAILNLVNLQTLILDQNKFEGEIPDVLSSFSSLSVLSLRNNSLEGSLPKSLSKLESLRVLALSHNRLSGQVPDLSSLQNLEELYLDNNSLGPQFPRIGTKLVNLVLRRNKFLSGIPDDISSFYQLQTFDVSFNKFMTPFPTSLLSLPSITYINVGNNEFMGVLLDSLPCNGDLRFVDVSNNHLTGTVPSCLLLNTRQRSVFYSGNCLSTTDQNQNPYTSCRNEALAAGVVPFRKRHMRAKVILIINITLGVLGGVVLLVIILWLLMRVHVNKIVHTQSQTSTSENTSGHCPSKLLSDARYISQTMKVGALGIPPFRSFSLEELEEATNNFDTSAFMGEGSHGQMYRGRLRDGSFVAIRCLKLKESRNSQYFMKHIELISKLRHRHLVSAMGYCFEYYLDDLTVSRFFLVFEYVPNGTLRHWVSGHARHKLTWSQRIAAMVAVARGIQFLHKGIVPGIFSNNLKTTDILLEQNFSAKISSYNLPLLPEIQGEVSSQPAFFCKNIDASPRHLTGVNPRIMQDDKSDIYDFGIILLETIMGRAARSQSELNSFKNQVQAGVTGDEATRRGIVAEEVGSMSSDQSLKTAMEMIVRCVGDDPAERPPMEDVIWNLQFMAQVQDAWQLGDTKCSPADAPPPHHLPRLRLTYQ